jgi:hypothetical protein
MTCPIPAAPVPATAATPCVSRAAGRAKGSFANFLAACGEAPQEVAPGTSSAGKKVDPQIPAIAKGTACSTPGDTKRIKPRPAETEGPIPGATAVLVQATNLIPNLSSTAPTEIAAAKASGDASVASEAVEAPAKGTSTALGTGVPAKASAAVPNHENEGVMVAGPARPLDSAMNATDGNGADEFFPVEMQRNSIPKNSDSPAEKLCSREPEGAAPAGNPRSQVKNSPQPLADPDPATRQNAPVPQAGPLISPASNPGASPALHSDSRSKPPSQATVVDSATPGAIEATSNSSDANLPVDTNETMGPNAAQITIKPIAGDVQPVHTAAQQSAVAWAKLRSGPGLEVSSGSSPQAQPAPRLRQSSTRLEEQEQPTSGQKVVPDPKSKPVLVAPLAPENQTTTTASKSEAPSGPQPQTAIQGAALSADPVHRSSESQARPASASTTLPGATADPANTSPATGMIRDAHFVDGSRQAEVHIGLRTTAFGSVEVHAVIRDSQVGLSIGSERGDLRHLLSTEVPGIEGRLQRHDLQLDSVKFFSQGASLDAGLASGGNTGSRHSSNARTSVRADSLAAGPDEPSIEPEIFTNTATGLNVRA